MSLMPAKRRDDSGAYAVLFGLMVIVMVGIGALAVDIGNAVARKSDVQGQADFAALAAGRASDGTLNAADKATIYATVADKLNQNSPLNHDCSSTHCVTAAELSDGLMPNGEVTFPGGRIKVTAPESDVDYALAGIFGIGNKLVQATATVGLFSPGIGTLPMYAVQGCDYGSQSLTDPANGSAAPVMPNNVVRQSDDTNATITDIVTPDPAQVPYTDPPTTPALTLSGVDFRKKIGPDDASVTRVGFFREDGSTVVTVPVNPADPAQVTDTSISIATIPASVTGVEDLWWIRVFKQKVSDFPSSPAIGEWTGIDNAQPLRVGAAQLDCGSGSNQGNFGTLTVPRWDVNAPADWLHLNIVKGPDAPLTLGLHSLFDPVTGRCTHGVAGAITSGNPNPGQNPGTNCVDTDTGLPAGAATTGFVTGATTSAGFVKGRLDGGEHPTDTSCGRSNYTVSLGSGPSNSYSTNNDILTCYLTNGSTLSSVAVPGYAGGDAFEDDMYLSPRFGYVPVLAQDPYTGGAGKYSIVEFRPVFITDESGAAFKNNSDVTANNGLVTQTTQIKQVKVFFFDMDALPASTPGPVTDYIPGAPKIVRLVD